MTRRDGGGAGRPPAVGTFYMRGVNPQNSLVARCTWSSSRLPLGRLAGHRVAFGQSPVASRPESREFLVAAAGPVDGDFAHLCLRPEAEDHAPVVGGGEAAS